MKDVLIVLFSFATVVGLFYLRVRQADGWLLLPRNKIQSLFSGKK